MQEEDADRLEQVLDPPQVAGAGGAGGAEGQGDLAIPGRRLSGVLILLGFGFGIAAGFLLAFSGLGFLVESATTVVAVFFVVLVLLSLAGLVVFLLRERILRRLFGLASTQVEAFAGPLGAVAQKAVARDPEGATLAARELVQRVLARYAWLSTRRWVVASLTALIAAMAALAGTALLFRQNELLAVQNRTLQEQNALITRQSALMQEQNARIREQTRLLRQSVELAEAQRNAGLAVEITAIAEALGAAMEQASARRGAARGGSDGVQVLDVARDLGGGLIMRIVAASQAARPYRFLDSGLNAHDQLDKARQAMLARRADLPGVWDRLAAQYGWEEAGAGADAPTLIDRPQSPERGQLLRVLVSAGVVRHEVLNFRGMDLSFADARQIRLFLTSMQGAQLAYADLSGATLREVDLSGAYAENIRLNGAVIEDSRFAPAVPGRLKPPFGETDGTLSASFLTGADFSRAEILSTTFRRVELTAARFDGALLAGVDFSGASLAAASFRDAVLVGVRFDGANLSSVEMDGAVLFGEDPLASLAELAAEGSFRADRYEAREITAQEALGSGVAGTYLEAGELAALGKGARAYRLIRVKPFGQ